jgi:hypothetical protein
MKKVFTCQAKGSACTPGFSSTQQYCATYTNAAQECAAVVGVWRAVAGFWSSLACTTCMTLPDTAVKILLTAYTCKLRVADIVSVCPAAGAAQVSLCFEEAAG